jgi:hypothetical protein
MSEQEPIDWEAFRIDPNDPKWQPQVKQAKKRWRRQFIKFPWAWADRLREVRHICTYRVALYVLYEYWRKGGKPVSVSNVALAKEGVAFGTKWRGLNELEQIGLVRIERRTRKSPIVTPLFLESR